MTLQFLAAAFEQFSFLGCRSALFPGGHTKLLILTNRCYTRLVCKLMKAVSWLNLPHICCICEVGLTCPPCSPGPDIQSGRPGWNIPPPTGLANTDHTPDPTGCHRHTRGQNKSWSFTWKTFHKSAPFFPQIIFWSKHFCHNDMIEKQKTPF